MATLVKVPDLGVEQAEVIELLVKPGDTVKKDQPIAVLESDKASLELPATEDGVLVSWSVKIGTMVKEGDDLLTFDAGQAAASGAEPKAKAAPAAAEAKASATSTSSSNAAVTQTAPAEKASPPQSAPAKLSAAVLVKVPDLGVEQAEVIELLVKPGDTIKKDQPIAVLESDKASLELPATEDGVLVSWSVKVGTAVKPGDDLFTFSGVGVDTGAEASEAEPAKSAASAEAASASESRADDKSHAEAPARAEVKAASTVMAANAAGSDAENEADARVHAGPAVRRLARELGVHLSAVTGSGPKGRLVKDDVHAWVKAQLSQPRAAAPAPTSGGLNLELPPEPDYTKWGEIKQQPRTRIQRKTAENLARSALIVPQVTQFDQADITDLEAFRLSLRDSFKADGLSLTMTGLVAKAVTYLLREMPNFNASLSRDGEQLVLKNYINLGIAVDTPNGLVVPVLHNADQMGLRELSRKLGELAEQARLGKLPPAAMQGASFTISSLGGIGGTAFTPLVNWPEVAILGLSRASQQPVWDGKAFMPRLTLPLSLSYDHRIIDGVAAARFTTRLAVLLADIRKLLV